MHLQLEYRWASVAMKFKVGGLWMILSLGVWHNIGNCWGLAFLSTPVHPNHNVFLVTEIFSVTLQSGTTCSLSVLWTLDLWLDVLLPNSQPISPILLNQYVRWRMLALTDCGWQKSTQTFAGCPFNNPFVYRGWGDAAGLGDTIPISITGEVSKDEVEIEFTSRDTSPLLTHLRNYGTYFKSTNLLQVVFVLNGLHSFTNLQPYTFDFTESVMMERQFISFIDYNFQNL